MSANISLNSNGEAEIFTGRNMPAWHGLGVTVKGLLTAKEAVKTAHLDWEVKLGTLHTDGGELVNGWARTYRADDGRTLGVVGDDRYTIIQNERAFSWFDEVIGKGQAVYDTAGALGQGERVWIQAVLEGQLFVNGQDEISQNVLLINSHDGSKALTVMLTPIRVVCQNTLSLAIRGSKTSHQIKIRHTEKWEVKQNEAQRVLGLTAAYYEDLKGLIELLAATPMNKDGMVKFTRELLPEPKTGEASTRLENRRDEIVSLFDRGTGNVGENRFDALNAVTEFASHRQLVKKSGNRLESVLWGPGSRLVQRAGDLLSQDLDLRGALKGSLALV